MATEPIERKLSAILHADVVGYSRLSSEDEVETHRQLRVCLEHILGVVERFGGKILNQAGDAILADFPTSVDAVGCGLRIQQELAEINNALPENRQMHFRIGINLGDVIVEGGEIYGNGVNIAARLQALAEPGEICISEAVYNAIGTKLPVEYEFHGEQNVKNISRPVRVWGVRLEAGEQPPTPSAQAVPKTHWKIPLAATAALVLAFSAWLIWSERTKQDEHSEALERAVSLVSELPSLAVLPFDNFSSAPDQEYFAKGMSEDLITDLSKISGLLVISRTSTFNYEGSKADIRDIAQDLGVRYVLEGSVRRAGDEVRINAQLIDADTGNHLWAERYDGKIDNIFDLQDQITDKIVSALALKLSSSEKEIISRAITENIEAYDYFLQGRDKFFLLSKAENPVAREFYEKAVELDPEFAEAWASLGWTHVFDFMNGWSSTPERSLELSMEKANRAISLDNTLPIAYFVRGLTHREMGHWSESLVDLEQAIKLDPNYANAHVLLATLLYYAGRPQEGLERMQKAIELNPHHPYNYPFHLGQAYFILKRYDEAIAEFEQAISTNPASERVHVWLAAALANAGNTDDAEWEVDQVITSNPDFSLERFLLANPFKNPEDMELLVDGLHKSGFN